MNATTELELQSWIWETLGKASELLDQCESMMTTDHFDPFLIVLEVDKSIFVLRCAEAYLNTAKLLERAENASFPDLERAQKCCDRFFERVSAMGKAISPRIARSIVRNLKLPFPY